MVLDSNSNYVINVSSLIRWYSKPNGIIRVQIELLKALFEDNELIKSGGGIYFVRYCRDVGSFVRCESDILIDTLNRFSVKCDAHELLAANNVDRAFHIPFCFKSDDKFVTMGFDWDDYPPNALDILRTKDVKIVTMIYDLIPIKYSKYCMESVVQSFPCFLNHVSWMANKIITISKSAKDDLTEFFNKNNWPLNDISVVCLGTSFGGANIVPIKKKKNYQIFYVSTIEPRKNHTLLLDAYQKLIKDGFTPPLLYFVGNFGWGGINDTLQKRLDDDGALSKYIRIVSGLGDEELHELMSNSIFSVFPSEYEGWGLPVVESLSMGIPVICSNSSSLPEATQGMATLLPPNDVIAWAEEIAKMATDKQYRLALEEKIINDFKCRDWGDFTKEFFSVLNSIN